MAAELGVIGAGFGRTGTDSMREALNILGFDPCHHMRSLPEDEAHKMNWRKLNAGGEADWELLLGGYGACVDWPSAYYWPQLMAALPDAKILLTWRSAESWWASFEKTILPILLADNETEETAPGSQLLPQRVFGGKPMTRQHCISVYEANVVAVKATVPAERLLVHSIGDGWAPLCTFLGTSIPDRPYPHSNTASQFQTLLGETPK